jgi:hypothetical protein
MLNIPGHKANENQNTLRFHFTPVRTAIMKSINNNECYKNVEKRNPLPCWWKCKLVQALWEAVWRFFKKLKIDLPYNIVTLLLGIY